MLRKRVLRPHVFKLPEVAHMKTEAQVVFVYGTLKRGCSNHHVMGLAHGVYLRDAALQGAVMFNLGYYPAVQLDPTYGRVTGELYEVPPDGMPMLDRLEGHPKFYKRERVKTFNVETGEPDCTAWVYAFPHYVPVAQAMPSGTWAQEGRA